MTIHHHSIEYWDNITAYWSELMSKCREARTPSIIDMPYEDGIFLMRKMMAGQQ